MLRNITRRQTYGQDSSSTSFSDYKEPSIPEKNFCSYGPSEQEDLRNEYIFHMSKARSLEQKLLNIGVDPRELVNRK